MDHSERLIELAKESFGETITEAENKLFDKVARGSLVDYSDDEERYLRAEVILWLCTDKSSVALVTHQGICFKGACVDGLLNLAYVNIQFPLYFEKCKMPGGIELHCAKLRELYLGGCKTGQVSAYGLTVEGHVFLRDGFKSEGEVNLTGATIGGDLDCSDGYFINSYGSAINASRVRVGSDVIFLGSFKSEGRVALIDSKIEGSLRCNGATFINNGEGKMAINASRLKCGGDISITRGFRAEGEVCFSGGTVGGNLECFDSKFCNNKGNALNCEALEVGGGIFLMSDFDGEVRLLGATVGQSLECDGGNFVNTYGYAINADSVSIGSSVFIRNSFKAHGEINLIGAKIGGDIDCENGHFINPEGIAIHGDQIKVGGSIFLRHGFRAEGIVIFSGGKIKNNLDCEYGQFTNKVGPAILAEGINVGGSVLLRSRHLENQSKDNIPKQFKAEGGVSFRGAVIGGDFNCQGSHFINISRHALVCSGAKINGNVYLCSNQRTDKKEVKTGILCNIFRAEGQVSFDNARISGTLYCQGENL